MVMLTARAAATTTAATDGSCSAFCVGGKIFGPSKALAQTP